MAVHIQIIGTFNLNFTTSSNAAAKNKKYILLNNLSNWGKLSLLMKFGQFMSYSKGNNFIKKFYKNCSLKTSSRLFCVSKELSTTSLSLSENEIFEEIKIKLVKIIKISPNQHAGLHRFLFTAVLLKIQKKVWK